MKKNPLPTPRLWSLSWEIFSEISADQPQNIPWRCGFWYHPDLSRPFSGVPFWKSFYPSQRKTFPWIVRLSTEWKWHPLLSKGSYSSHEEGSKSHLRCRLPTMKFVCPKMKWKYVNLLVNWKGSATVNIPAQNLSAVESFTFTLFHFKKPAPLDFSLFGIRIANLFCNYLKILRNINMFLPIFLCTLFWYGLSSFAICKICILHTISLPTPVYNFLII